MVLIQTFRTRFDPDENVELNQSLVALKKILENELADSPVLISEYPPDGLILVVNLPFHHHTQESLSKLLNRCLASWRGDNLAAAIGKPVPSLSEIPASYQNARQAITWHIYPEAGLVIEPEVTNCLPPPVIMPGDDILQAVLRNDPKDIRLQFTSYFDSLITAPLQMCIRDSCRTAPLCLLPPKRWVQSSAQCLPDHKPLPHGPHLPCR